MNRDLLIKTYRLLKSYIKKNEEDLIVYNEMKKNGESATKLNEFAKNMQPVVDNFYALKPLYFAYRDKPTKEIENEILSRFGKELGVSKEDDVKETTKEEIVFPKVDSFPGLNAPASDPYFNSIFKELEANMASKAEEVKEFPTSDEPAVKVKEFPALDEPAVKVKEFPVLESSRSKKEPKKRVFNRVFKGFDLFGLKRIRNFFRNIKNKFSVSREEPSSLRMKLKK